MNSSLGGNLPQSEGGRIGCGDGQQTWFLLESTFSLIPQGALESEMHEGVDPASDLHVRQSLAAGGSQKWGHVTVWANQILWERVILQSKQQVTLTAAGDGHSIPAKGIWVGTSGGA